MLWRAASLPPFPNHGTQPSSPTGTTAFRGLPRPEPLPLPNRARPGEPSLTAGRRPPGVTSGPRGRRSPGGRGRLRCRARVGFERGFGRPAGPRSGTSRGRTRDVRTRRPQSLAPQTFQVRSPSLRTVGRGDLRDCPHRRDTCGARPPRRPPAHLGDAVEVVAGVGDAETQYQGQAHAGAEEPHADLALQVEGELPGQHLPVHRTQGSAYTGHHTPAAAGEPTPAPREEEGREKEELAPASRCRCPLPAPRYSAAPGPSPPLPPGPGAGSEGPGPGGVTAWPGGDAVPVGPERLSRRRQRRLLRGGATGIGRATAGDISGLLRCHLAPSLCWEGREAVWGSDRKGTRPES